MLDIIEQSIKQREAMNIAADEDKSTATEEALNEMALKVIIRRFQDKLYGTDFNPPTGQCDPLDVKNQVQKMVLCNKY